MKYKLVTILIFILALRLFAFPVKITSWQIDDDIKLLNSLNVSIDYVNRDSQTIIAYVRDYEELNKLLSNGFRVEQITDLAKVYADSLWEATKDSDDPLRAYYTLAEYETFLQNTVTQYPNICQLVQFGSSVQNRPLYFLKISDNVSVEENESEVRLVSSMHGDEVVGFDLLIRLIQLLTTQYSTNTRITNIVNNTELWINPMLNPDGYNAHSRYNTNGADLNRNFPLPVGSQHPDGMAWQPETIAIMNHGDAHSINYSLNYHGGALVANYPWDYIYTLCPDNNLFIQAALNYSINNTQMYNSTEFPQGITNGAAWYIALGSLQDWSYAYTGGLDITVEVSNTKWPSSSTLDSYWNLNQESLLSTIEFVQKGVHGTVTNTLGEPLSASISINSSGINIKTDPQVGDYHRMLLPGTYLVTASSPGYQSSSAEVIIHSNTPAIQNFILQSVTLTNFSGQVINQNGVTVSNAMVRLTNLNTTYQTITDNQGHFLITDLPEDTFSLTVQSNGYGIFQTDFILDASSKKQIIILPNPLFSDNFENGLLNWTVQSPWSIITQDNNHVLTDSPTGNYLSNQNTSIRLTNPISLQNVSNAVLSFDIKYFLESGYDYLKVFVSTDNSNWTVLAEYTGAASDWQNKIISLNNYLGSAIYIRFSLVTDGAVTADGVYIDNVVISGLSTNQTIYGDTDSNWMINMQDIQNVLEYSVGNNPIPLIDSYPWETFRFEAADVDNDGQITATDSYYIYNRYVNYVNPFPAQGGITIAFNNPGLEITRINNILSFDLSIPQNLKSLNLSLSSATGLVLDVWNWNIDSEDIYTATNLDSRSLAIICTNNAFPAANFLNLGVVTPDDILHCMGLINDIPINIDVQITSNDDNQIGIFQTKLIGNYPNPFNPETTISFSLAKNNTPINLSVYNAKGQYVKTLLNTSLSKGLHMVRFDGFDEQGKPLSNGLYFYRLVTPEQVLIQKMVILK